MQKGLTKRAQEVDSIEAEALQIRCDRILEDLHLADIAFHLSKEEKKALKQEFNEISQNLEGLIQGPTMDPLISLPPELWIDIIRQATRRNHINLSSMDALFPLVLVNKQWSTTILNTPGLWTEIIVGTEEEADAQAKLETVLFLSKDLPITLTLSLLPCQWEDILPLLQLHSHRIKEIILTYSGNPAHNQSQMAEFVNRLFPALHHLPCLESFGSLRVAHRKIAAKLNWGDIFSISPNLTRVHELAVPFEVIPTRESPPIRACTISASSSNVVSHIKDICYMEELSWRPKDDNAICRSSISLHRMLALKYINSYNVCIANMLKILKLASNLSFLALTIHSEWQYLYDLFNLLGYLPCLAVLRIFMKSISGKLAFPPGTKTLKTSVQDLHIADYTFDDIYLDRNQESLFLGFPSRFPDVNNLVLRSINLSPNVTAYIRSLSRLCSLRIRDMSIPSAPNPSIDSPCLQTIRVEVKYQRLLQRLVSILNCPVLSKLHLIDYGLPLTTVQSQYQYWDNTLIYDNIRTLDIMTFQVAQWEIHRFRVLQRLRVDGDVEDLLTGFILDPGNCPMLEEVETTSIPEWDLLFLMLERRNYLPSSRGIARIRSLTLPYPIPPDLLVPLTRILSGQFTERPSNKDLSFSGFMDAYFDPAIPGCLTCLSSMMSCATPARKLPWEEILPRPMPIILPSVQPEISGEIWQWLKGRDKRLVEWRSYYEEWKKGGDARTPLCTEMMFKQQPFIVNGCSF